MHTYYYTDTSLENCIEKLVRPMHKSIYIQYPLVELVLHFVMDLKQSTSSKSYNFRCHVRFVMHSTKHWKKIIVKMKFKWFRSNKQIKFSKRRFKKKSKWNTVDSVKSVDTNRCSSGCAYRIRDLKKPCNSTLHIYLFCWLDEFVCVCVCVSVSAMWCVLCGSLMYSHTDSNTFVTIRLANSVK